MRVDLLEGGYIDGISGFDSLKIGQLVVSNQSFVQVSNVSSSLWSGYTLYLRCGGIVGLGFSANSKIAGSLSFLDNAKKQNKIAKKLVAFRLRRKIRYEDTRGGEVTIGGFSPDSYSGIKNIERK